MKWMQRCPFRPFATKEYFTKADAIDLPDYLAAVPNWVSGVIAMASNSPAPAAPQAVRAFPENAVSKVIYPGRRSAERECWCGVVGTSDRCCTGVLLVAVLHVIRDANPGQQSPASAAP